MGRITIELKSLLGNSLIQASAANRIFDVVSVLKQPEIAIDFRGVMSVSEDFAREWRKQKRILRDEYYILTFHINMNSQVRDMLEKEE